jgi:hypothetical protein
MRALAFGYCFPFFTLKRLAIRSPGRVVTLIEIYPTRYAATVEQMLGRRFVLRPIALIIGRQAVAKVLPVSLWIDDPGKLPILGFVNLLEHIAAFFLQGLDQGVEVFHR